MYFYSLEVSESKFFLPSSFFPDKAFGAFCCIILTLALFLKESLKATLLSQDRELILPTDVKKEKRQHYVKKI